MPPTPPFHRPRRRQGPCAFRQTGKIRPGAESLLPCPFQHDGAHGRSATALREQAVKGGPHLEAHGIQPLGLGERDAGEIVLDAIVDPAAHMTPRPAGLDLAGTRPIFRQRSAPSAPLSASGERRVCGCAREAHRLAYKLHLPEAGMRDGLRDVQVLHLRVGEHLVHAIDRPRRNAHGLQPLQPRGGGVGAEHGSSTARTASRWANLASLRGINPVIREIGALDRLAQLRHWPSPPTPILMKPSEVSITPMAWNRDGRFRPAPAPRR